MNDDAAALRALWMSEPPPSENILKSTVAQVLERDRMERLREGRRRLAGMAAIGILLPVLIWASVYGVAPLVRGAYALMAVGCAGGLVAEWLYLEWSRRALPGPDDTRSHLQKTAFMLERQMWLVKTCPLSSSPLFIGGVFIALWLYDVRTATAAITLLTLDVAAWIVSGVVAWRAASAIGVRRRQMEEMLADLR
jgi:hypothetical protein